MKYRDSVNCEVNVAFCMLFILFNAASAAKDYLKVDFLVRIDHYIESSYSIKLQNYSHVHEFILFVLSCDTKSRLRLQVYVLQFTVMLTSTPLISNDLNVIF